MMMIQVMDSKKNLYNGTWLCDQARLEMTSVCLNKKPAHCNYLSGELQLLVIKRSFKFACNRSSGAVQEQGWLIAASICQGRYRRSSVENVFITCLQVSVRLSYRLDDWAGYTWMIDPPDLDLFTM